MAVYLPVAAWILLCGGASVLARHFTIEGEVKMSTVKKHTITALLFLAALTALLFVLS